MRVGAQLPRPRGVLQGRPQRLRPLVEDRAVRRMAIPALPHPGDATSWRDQQVQDRLLQGRPVRSGVAVGEAHGLRIACRNIRPAERQAGRVARIEAQGQACLGTAREGERREAQLAALGVGLSERTGKRKALEHLGVHALTPHQSEGFVSKKLRWQGQGPVGKAKAIQDHPRHGFARCDHFLRIRYETCMDHINQAYVFNHRSNLA